MLETSKQVASFKHGLFEQVRLANFNNVLGD